MVDPSGGLESLSQLGLYWCLGQRHVAVCAGEIPVATQQRGIDPAQFVDDDVANDIMMIQHNSTQIPGSWMVMLYLRCAWMLDAHPTQRVTHQCQADWLIPPLSGANTLVVVLAMRHQLLVSPGWWYEIYS